MKDELFELVDKGVRVYFVSALDEGWLYVGRSKLLLIDEGLEDDDIEHARTVVLRELEKA